MFGMAGFVGSDGAHAQPDNGFKGAQGTYSNGGETWMEVRERIAAHTGSPGSDVQPELCGAVCIACT